MILDSDAVGHSPLTGIFLIRSLRSTFQLLVRPTPSQSPDGDFFDPEWSSDSNGGWIEIKSQSPDGDFFDPEAFEA